MGSSGPHVVALVLTVVCGLLFLLFDAARHFAQQIGPVGLRRLAGDPAREGRGRWLQFDAQNLQLVSGSLLQIGLVISIAGTVVLCSDRGAGYACLIAGAIWIGIVIVWKFVLALVPEELDERMLKTIIPVTHFFYFVFWPLLHPLRRLVERMEREDEDDDEDEEIADDTVRAYIDVGEEEGILEKSEIGRASCRER